MPTKDAHLAAARQNQSTIGFLLNASNDDHLPWVVTVAFYKALHVVEALFASQASGEIQHTDDHRQRNDTLKTTVRFQQIWKMYRPLYNASLIARYLRDNASSPTFEVFSKYMSKEEVESKVLGHYLHQVQASASRLADDPEFLT